MGNTEVIESKLQTDCIISRNPKKLKRCTVSREKMMSIADAMGIGYEQAFVLEDGEKKGLK